jgi:hypothetical protein
MALATHRCQEWPTSKGSVTRRTVAGMVLSLVVSPDLGDASMLARSTSAPTWVG